MVETHDDCRMFSSQIWQLRPNFFLKKFLLYHCHLLFKKNSFLGVVARMPKLARKEKQTNKQTNKPCGKTAEL